MPLQEHGIGASQIDALYHFAKFQFDCGNYSAAQEYLLHYRTLSTDNERNMSALWGKLAAELLLQSWCARGSQVGQSSDSFFGLAEVSIARTGPQQKQKALCSDQACSAAVTISKHARVHYRC